MAVKRDRPRARQLALDLAEGAPRYDRALFLVGDCNREALAIVDAFAASTAPTLAIAGPPASGKTHLAHVLAASAPSFLLGADTVSAEAGETERLLVIDDVKTWRGPAELLALIERRRARGWRTALAGRGEPADWAQGFPDLRTRLSALPRARLGEPDEVLLRAVIEKGFADRRLRVGPDVVAYAAPRLPRTFAAAEAFIALAAQEMREAAGDINLPRARKVLSNLSEALPPA